MLDLLITNTRISQSLAVDNATSIAVLTGWRGGQQYLTGIQADYSGAVAAVKTITIKKGPSVIANGPVTAAGLAIGSTDRNVQTNALTFIVANTQHAKGAVAAGTALAAGTIPADTWGVYVYSITAGGTIHCTAGAANFTTGYASESAALVGTPNTPAGEAILGVVTVLTAVGFAFIGGTDSLEGGGTGHVSSDTHYYDTTAIGSDETVCTLSWDFTNGPYLAPLPGYVRGEMEEAVRVELAASGAGGTTGHVTIFGFSK